MLIKSILNIVNTLMLITNAFKTEEVITMSPYENVLILKLTEGEEMPINRLAQLADGHWKVNAIRIQSVRAVIVMIHKKVMADFFLNDHVTLELNTGRISNLGLTNAHNITGLVGNVINYGTANPATIKPLKDLKKIIAH